RPEKLLYAEGEAGTIDVTLFNGTAQPQPAHLTAEIASGLEDRAKIYDQDVTVAAPDSPGEATVIKVPMPAQSEYGHGLIVTLRQGGQIVGTAREYFYV